MPNIVVRLLSALVLIPVVVGIYLVGEPYWGLFLALVAGLISFEWLKLIRNTHAAMHSVLIGLCFAIFTQLPDVPYWGVVVLGIPAAIMGQATHKPLALLTGLYIALPVALIMQIGDTSTFILLWLAGVVWMTDTFALLFGKTIGGPKLAPKLSPKKTWAGLFGGMFGALMITGLFMYGLPQVSPSLYAWAAGLSVIGQVGDLFESKFKRKFDVKDSGALIPGHGGILDRMDSFLFAAPAVWVLMLLGILAF